ncbi:hypothetical protein HYV30_01780 [Candidatus Kaiserbacteria bacterium]|nr:hypothetical protein [Candidatus Kaiserbacteria bacterium]
MPTQNGESWECRRLDQIGSGGRSGSGVVVVWLVTRHEPQVAPMPMASATQLRKQGREEHRRRLAPAAYA